MVVLVLLLALLVMWVLMQIPRVNHLALAVLLGPILCKQAVASVLRVLQVKPQVPQGHPIVHFVLLDISQLLQVLFLALNVLQDLMLHLRMPLLVYYVVLVLPKVKLLKALVCNAL